MQRPSHFRAFLIILTVSIFTLFLHNGVLPANLMEARNLATAQEMVRTGNYLIPTMNGELRLEKPPLPTWISACVERMEPEDLAAQRRVTALVTVFMALFLYFFVFRFSNDRRLALMSALVLVTSYNVIMNGRTATWDIYCHAFMLAALYYMFSAIEGRGAQWLRFAAAGFWMGMSFLGKGPVSFYALLLPAAVSYAVVRRPRLRGKGLPLTFMILICLAISFWWPLYIALFHADAGAAVAVKESSAWMHRNVRPLWYYWHFPDESGIWALFWISSIIFYFKGRRPQHRQLYAFMILWNALIFVCLSLVPEKKTRYLLPILIPGAVNVAFYFWHCLKAVPTIWEKRLYKLNGWLIVLIAIAMPVAMYLAFVRPHAMSWGLFIPILVIYWITAAFVYKGICNFRDFRPLQVFAGVVIIMTVFTATCFTPAGRLFLNESRHSIRAMKEVPQAAGLDFYHPADEPLRMELVYEANRCILPLDLQDDAALARTMPFVLVSMEPAETLLQGRPVSIEYIDTYDNNWRKTDSRRHNAELVLRAAIIRPGERSTSFFPAADHDVSGVDQGAATLSEQQDGIPPEYGIDNNQQGAGEADDPERNRQQ